MTPEEALRATLAGEHAAVYVYGVLGGRVSRSAEPALADRLATAYTLHRGRRDQLLAMVRDTGEEPVASEVSYRLPNAAETAAQVSAVALGIETRCCEVYADMVGSTAGPARQWAIGALNDAAVRLLEFGGSPEPFPGVPGL